MSSQNRTVQKPPPCLAQSGGFWLYFSWLNNLNYIFASFRPLFEIVFSVIQTYSCILSKSVLYFISEKALFHNQMFILLCSYARQKEGDLYGRHPLF